MIVLPPSIFRSHSCFRSGSRSVASIDAELRHVKDQIETIEGFAKGIVNAAVTFAIIAVAVLAFVIVWKSL